MKRYTLKIVIDDDLADTDAELIDTVREAITDVGDWTLVSNELLETQDLPDPASDEDKENTNTENETTN